VNILRFVQKDFVSPSHSSATHGYCTDLSCHGTEPAVIELTPSVMDDKPNTFYNPSSPSRLFLFL